MAKKKLEADEKMTFILEDKRNSVPSSHQKAIVRETNNPVIFDNGYKVNSNYIKVDGKPIADAMRFISKMTSGIVTGVLAEDKEYIRLQRKFIDLMIRDKVKEVKREVEEKIKVTKDKYSIIAEGRQEALDSMRESVAKVTKEHSLYIFMNTEGECVSVTDPKDIEKISGSWTQVSLRELKDIRDAKEKKKTKKKLAKTKTAKKKAKKKSDR